MEVEPSNDILNTVEPPLADIPVKRERSSEPATPAPDFDALPTPPSKRRKLSEDPQSTHSGSVPPSETPNLNLNLHVVRNPTFNPSPDGLPYYTTTDVPMNRQGFRYIPAQPSPPGSFLSHRTVESQPAGYVRVSWEDRSPYTRVSQDGLGILGEKGFRSARLNVPVKEGKWYFEVNIEKGGGDGADAGRVDGAHVRLGWGRREAPLNGPCGLDGYSYAYRDKSGDKVTLSRPKPYGKPFGSGDVIGLYISLPPRRQPAEKDPTDPARVVRKRIAINYKNQLYFESMDYTQSKEMQTLMELRKPSAAPSKKDASMKQNSQADKTSAASRRRKAKPTSVPEAPTLRSLPTLGPESCIAFFVNGQSQGPAFTDLYDYLQLRASAKKDVRGRRNLPYHLRERENLFDDGSLGYYPFLSVFNDARIQINAGPDFAFPPPPDIDPILFPGPDSKPTADVPNRTWRPLCERYAEYIAEEFAQDELDEQEAQRSAAAAQRAEETERKREEARLAKEAKREAKRAAKVNGKKSALGTEVISADDLLALQEGTETTSVEPTPGAESGIAEDGVVVEEGIQAETEPGEGVGDGLTHRIKEASPASSAAIGYIRGAAYHPASPSTSVTGDNDSSESDEEEGPNEITTARPEPLSVEESSYNHPAPEPTEPENVDDELYAVATGELEQLEKRIAPPPSDEMEWESELQ